MGRFRTLTLAVLLVPVAFSTADAQWPENDPWNQDYSGGRTVYGRRHGFSAVSQLNFATTLTSSAFGLALSSGGKDGKAVSRRWAWSAVGVGFGTVMSGFFAFQQPGAEPLLAMTSLVSGGLSMVVGTRILKRANQTPDQGAFFPPRETVSISPTVAPTTRSAGVHVSVRF